MAANHLTPEARTENATTLAAALGLSIDSASELLDLDVLVTLDSGDPTALIISEEVCGMLGRTVRRCAREPSGTSVACELVIGAASSRTCGPHVYLSVTEAGAQAGRNRITSNPCAPIPSVYALLIACYASAAALYHATGGVLPFGLPEPLQIEFDELGLDPSAFLQPINIGHAYLAGAGAIGNGLLWAARYLDFHGELEIVDDDDVSSGNLNRQIWFGPDDISHPKADHLAALARSSVPHLTLLPRRARLQDLPEKSAGPWLSRLIVAVDSRRARRQLQNEFPGEVFDASTTDIREIVVHHHKQPTAHACLSCIYETDTEEFSREHHIAEHLGVSVEEVRSERISEAAAITIAGRFPGVARTMIAGTAYDSLFKRLCAEGALRVSADRRVVAPFAFVSVLAGTLLALELVRHLSGDGSVRDFNYWRVSPWHPPRGRRRIIRNRQAHCAFCGDSILSGINSALWDKNDAETSGWSDSDAR